MSVALDGNIVRLTGECRVEDAEPLLSLLQGNRSRIVDLSEAGYLHTALVQVLLAASPTMRGSSLDPFIRGWIQPLLSQPQTRSAEAPLSPGLE
jgi:hypothetical protein